MLRRLNRQLFPFGFATAMLVGCTSTGGSSGQIDSAADTSSARADVSAGADVSAIDSNKPIQGEGYKVGQISNNWTLTDHNGKPVNLYDYRGKVIYFESGSEW